ncbi:hypothetical protein DIPPA_14136 [Diplonema papillatum]|nr:hypothetical protein DIPPA_14136 [Diplonema papillatum]
MQAIKVSGTNPDNGLSYVCWNHLPVAIRDSFKNFFQQQGGIVIYFCAQVHKVGRKIIPQTRVLLISHACLYQCMSNSDVNRCVKISDIAELIFSHDDWLGVRVPSQYDLLFKMQNRDSLDNFRHVLSVLYRELVGKELKVTRLEKKKPIKALLSLKKPPRFELKMEPVVLKCDVWRAHFQRQREGQREAQESKHVAFAKIDFTKLATTTDIMHAAPPGADSECSTPRDSPVHSPRDAELPPVSAESPSVSASPLREQSRKTLPQSVTFNPIPPMGEAPIQSPSPEVSPSHSPNASSRQPSNDSIPHQPPLPTSEEVDETSDARAHSPSPPPGGTSAQLRSLPPSSILPASPPAKPAPSAPPDGFPPPPRHPPPSSGAAVVKYSIGDTLEVRRSSGLWEPCNVVRVDQDLYLVSTATNEEKQVYFEEADMYLRVPPDRVDAKGNALAEGDTVRLLRTLEVDGITIPRGTEGLVVAIPGDVPGTVAALEVDGTLVDVVSEDIEKDDFADGTPPESNGPSDHSTHPTASSPTSNYHTVPNTSENSFATPLSPNQLPRPDPHFQPNQPTARPAARAGETAEVPTDAAPYPNPSPRVSTSPSPRDLPGNEVHGMSEEPSPPPPPPPAPPSHVYNSTFSSQAFGGAPQEAGHAEHRHHGRRASSPGGDDDSDLVDGWRMQSVEKSEQGGSPGGKRLPEQYSLDSPTDVGEEHIAALLHQGEFGKLGELVTTLCAEYRRQVACLSDELHRKTEDFQSVEQAFRQQLLPTGSTPTDPVAALVSAFTHETQQASGSGSQVESLRAEARALRSELDSARSTAAFLRQKMVDSDAANARLREQLAEQPPAACQKRVDELEEQVLALEIANEAKQTDVLLLREAIVMAERMADSARPGHNSSGGFSPGAVNGFNHFTATTGKSVVDMSCGEVQEFLRSVLHLSDETCSKLSGLTGKQLLRMPVQELTDLINEADCSVLYSALGAKGAFGNGNVPPSPAVSAATTKTWMEADEQKELTHVAWILSSRHRLVEDIWNGYEMVTSARTLASASRFQLKKEHSEVGYGPHGQALGEAVERVVHVETMLHKAEGLFKHVVTEHFMDFEKLHLGVAGHRAKSHDAPPHGSGARARSKSPFSSMDLKASLHLTPTERRLLARLTSNLYKNSGLRVRTPDGRVQRVASQRRHRSVSPPVEEPTLLDHHRASLSPGSSPGLSPRDRAVFPMPLPSNCSFEGDLRNQSSAAFPSAPPSVTFGPPAAAGGFEQIMYLTPPAGAGLPSAAPSEATVRQRTYSPQSPDGRGRRPVAHTGSPASRPVSAERRLSPSTPRGRRPLPPMVAFGRSALPRPESPQQRRRRSLVKREKATKRVCSVTSSSATASVLGQVAAPVKKKHVASPLGNSRRRIQQQQMLRLQQEARREASPSVDSKPESVPLSAWHTDLKPTHMFAS